jgi:H+/Cl- antiporter ClcA
VNFSTSLVLGLVFGVLAGASAYVIAYSEYKRNWSFSGSAVRMALRTAFVTFAFFFLAGLVLPWIFQQVVGR